MRLNFRVTAVALLAAIVLGFAPVNSIRAQSGDGYTLDQAVEAARQKTGGKVLRAKTKSSNGRKVHEIRVLTSNGHVRTLRFKAQRSGKEGG